MREASFETLIRRFAADESGATAVEYAILAALVTGAIIVSVQNVGTALSGVFNNVATKLEIT